MNLNNVCRALPYGNQTTKLYKKKKMKNENDFNKKIYEI